MYLSELIGTNTTVGRVPRKSLLIAYVCIVTKTTLHIIYVVSSGI